MLNASVILAYARQSSSMGLFLQSYLGLLFHYELLATARAQENRLLSCQIGSLIPSGLPKRFKERKEEELIGGSHSKEGILELGFGMK